MREVSDVVVELRDWVYTHRLYATAQKAAEEIEELRDEVASLKSRLRYEHAINEQLVSEADDARALAAGLRRELYNQHVRAEVAAGNRPDLTSPVGQATCGSRGCARRQTQPPAADSQPDPVRPADLPG